MMAFSRTAAGGILLISLLLLGGCWDKKPARHASPGKPFVGQHDGRMVGNGHMTVNGVRVSVQGNRLTVNGVNFGSVPRDAVTVIQVDDRGGFEIWVNDEKRKPDEKSQRKPIVRPGLKPGMK